MSTNSDELLLKAGELTYLLRYGIHVSIISALYLFSSLKLDEVSRGCELVEVSRDSFPVPEGGSGVEVVEGRDEGESVSLLIEHRLSDSVAS